MDRALPPNPAATTQRRVAGGFLAAMAVGTYPLALLPRGVVGRRFDLDVPWPGLVAVAALGFLALRTGRAGESALLSPRRSFAWSTGLSVLTMGALVGTLAGGPPALAAAGAIWLPLLVIALVAGTVMPIVSLHGWALPAPIVVAIGWLEVARGGEWGGTFGNWNFFGTYLALSLMVAGHQLHGMIRDRRRRDTPWLGAWALVALTCLIGLGLSRSRGAWAALAAGAAWYALPARWSARRRLALVAAGVAAATAVSWGVRAPSGPWARAGSDVRPWIWSGAWAIVGELPLAGTGAGRFVDFLPQLRPVQYMALPEAADVTLHAHHWPLQLVAEWGLLGAPLWIALLVAAFGGGQATGSAGTAADRTRRQQEAALALILVQNLVDVGMFMPPLRSLTWWLAGSLLGGRWSARPDPPRPAGEEAVAVVAPGATVGTVTRVRRSRSALAIIVALAAALAWISVIRPAVASYGYWRGQQALDRNDWATAARGYAQACRWSGAHRSALYKLGFVRSQAGDLPGALAAYERLAAISPGYAEVQANLTRLRLMERRPDRALPHALAQVTLDPFDADHWARLASCHFELGDAAAGLHALHEALAIDPQHAYARSTLARLEAEGKAPSPGPGPETAPLGARSPAGPAR